MMHGHNDIPMSIDDSDDENQPSTSSNQGVTVVSKVNNFILV